MGRLLLALIAATPVAAQPWGPYTYDGSGNIKQIGTDVFTYDGDGRLVSGSVGTATQSVTYDAFNNVLTITSTTSAGTTVSRFAVDDQTSQIDSSASASPPFNVVGSFDASGNMESYNGSSFFSYDASNTVEESTTPDGGRRVYIYTATDERVGTFVMNGAQVTRSEWTFRNAGNKVLRRYTKTAGGDWQWQEDYVYGGGRLLAADVNAPEKRRQFHLDHLGTPRLITGNGGVAIERHSYLPFGQEVSPPPSGETMKFTGHERDSKSLDYMHARYYDPLLGRFLSVDPTSASAVPQQPHSWNRYNYALNNPLSLVDRNGMWPTRTHEKIYKKALPGLSVMDFAVIFRSSFDADDPFHGGWFPGESHEHGLRRGSQSVAEAQLMASNFYTQKIEAAIAASKSGEKSAHFDALYELGRALHLVTDMTSPAHAGFAEWNLADPWAHIILESRAPTKEEMAMAVAMVQAAYAQVFGMEALQRAITAAPPKQNVIMKMPEGAGPTTADGGTILICIDGMCR